MRPARRDGSIDALRDAVKPLLPRALRGRKVNFAQGAATTMFKTILAATDGSDHGTLAVALEQIPLR